MLNLPSLTSVHQLAGYADGYQGQNGAVMGNSPALFEGVLLAATVPFILALVFSYAVAVRRENS